jgi:Holliday junction resolvase
MTPEGKVKKEIKKVLDAQGVLFYMPMGSGWGRSGMPDFVASVNGIFVGIEAKAGKKLPTELQQRELTKINQSGGLGICINAENLDTLDNLIKNLKLYGHLK